MSTSLAQAETALVEALHQRSQAYRNAQASLTALQQRLMTGDAPLHSICPKLLEVLDTIRSVDERLAPLQAQWSRFAARPGAELAAQIEQHQQQLEQTLALVNALTATAEADRAQLAPRLDEAARGRRMQAAYAASVDY